MMRRVVLLCLAVAASALMLSACTSSSSGAATNATFNGVTALDATAGSANLSVSALDSQGHVVTTGTLSGASATVTSVATSAGPIATSYSANATICGQITGSSGDMTGILTLDATGSMSSSDPTMLRADAAKGFVARMASTDRAAIASFDTNVTPTAGYMAIYLHQTLTSDKSLLDTAIDAATYDGGTTNLWDAGVDSADYLAAVTGSNKMALLLTDGADNSSTSTPADVISAAQTGGVKVYTVGLGSYVDAQDLIDIASQTGGTYAQVQNASDLSGLFDSIFNATLAAGCIHVQFSPVPASGHIITGRLTFKVDGQLLTADYVVHFP